MLVMLFLFLGQCVINFFYPLDSTLQGRSDVYSRGRRSPSIFRICSG